MTRRAGREKGGKFGGGTETEKDGGDIRRMDRGVVEMI
jgi:hypothetical protein